MTSIKSDKKSEFVCFWCNKHFVTWTYRKPKFCSAQCRSEYGAKQPRRKRAIDLVTICCEQCGNEYTVHRCFTRNGRSSRFCKRACLDKWNSENMMGAGNHNYSGGVKFPDRGSNWIMQRKKTLERDGHKCQICGSQKTKKHVLDVHHIVPYKAFNGDYLKANDFSNLITLCRACHVKVEHHGYPCPHPS